MLVAISSATFCGVHGQLVTVEIHIYRCSLDLRARYRIRLSTSLLNQVDLGVVLERPEAPSLTRHMPAERHRPAENGAGVAESVLSVRNIAMKRGCRLNSMLDRAILEKVAPLRGGTANLFEQQRRCGSHSTRGENRLSRVVQTTAELDGNLAAVKDRNVVQGLALRAGLLHQTVGLAS